MRPRQVIDGLQLFSSASPMNAWILTYFQQGVRKNWALHWRIEWMNQQNHSGYTGWAKTSE